MSAPAGRGSAPAGALRDKARPTGATPSANAVQAGASPPSPSARDRAWMARALEMARAAAFRGEVPVGAVIVRENRLLAESHNRTAAWSDPTAHAEAVAIRSAARALGDWRLEGCTLYTTLEPCAHCAGAVVLARLPRLVYGAPDPKAGMAGTLGDLVRDPRLNHRAEVLGDVLADESAKLLRAFFRARREQSKS